MDQSVRPGTTAAAACKGAILSLQRPTDEVKITTPAKIEVSLAVVARNGFCVAAKDGGDHQFDVTEGLEMMARAVPAERTGLAPGKGVGRIVAAGLCDEAGRPAISPSARRQIMQAIKEGLQETGLAAARVELCIPGGEALAEKTLNPRLGILGGISILGSTGFVEPWNDHLGEMKGDLIRDTNKVVLTTGRIGMRYSHMLFPDYTVVMVGSRISEGLDNASGDVIVCGLPGLVLKWGNPDLLEGSGYATVVEMLEKAPENERLKEAFEMATEKGKGARIVVIDRDGSVLMDSKSEN